MDVLVTSMLMSKRKPLAPLVGVLRSVKSECEVEVMKASVPVEISARAHAKTIRFAQPGLSKADLQAHFEYICARGGEQRPAYVPVVASGENALVIHYTRNDHLYAMGNWCSSTLRLCSRNLTYLPRKRHLHPAPTRTLLGAPRDPKSARERVRRLVRTSLQSPHRRSVDILRLSASACRVRGIVSWSASCTRITSRTPSESTCTSRGLWRGACHELKEGMVITIEPGVYVPADPQYPKHFHGLGMRIENEVLVGAEHPVVLSASAPKEIEDIEGACQGWDSDHSDRYFCSYHFF
ncbi:peptidase M24, structural domain-containing protein [Russula emetica]|nr:peptidase M24, structural domain-containing protein [Russula emetica]